MAPGTRYNGAYVVLSFRRFVVLSFCHCCRFVRGGLNRLETGLVYRNDLLVGKDKIKSGS